MNAFWGIHRLGESTPSEGRRSAVESVYSGRLVALFVGAAFLTELTVRLFESYLPAAVSETATLVAILMLLTPGLYLVTRREAAALTQWSLFLAIFFAIAPQILDICMSVPFMGTWPIMLGYSQWRGEIRSAFQLFGLVLLLGTFYYSLLSALRAKAAISREVGERLQAEERSQREFLFREAVIENTAEGLCVCHVIDGFPYLEFTVWNRRMAEITGYSMEEINRLGWHQCMPSVPDLQTRAANRIARMRHGAHLKQVELPIVRQDGARRVVSVSTSFVEGFGEQARILAVLSDITLHKKSEMVLEREATLRRALFEKSKDGILVLTLDGTVFEANEAMCTMLGYSPEEMSQLRVWDWDELLTADQVVMTLRKLSVGSATFETVHRRKDGTRVNVEVSANGVTSGDRILVYCVHRNITARKEAEAALLESETRYRRIVDTAIEGIWVMDAGLTTQFVNTRMAEMLGYRVDEMEGIGIERYVWSDDLPVFREQVKVRRGGRSGHYELRWRHKCGAAIWTIVSATPTSDRQGHFTGSFAMLTDITERKQMEDVLRESEGFYRQLFEKNTAIKLLIDPATWAIVDANPAAVEYYGYTREQIKSLSILDLNILSVEDISREMKNAFEGARSHFCFKHRLATGEIRDVEVYSGPVDVNGRHLLSSIIHDVTERKRAEAELEHIYAYAPCIMWHADVTTEDGDEKWTIRVANLESAQRFLPLDMKPGQVYFDALWQSRQEFPEYCTRADDVASRALREGLTSFHQEFPCRTRDGEMRWIYEDAHIQPAGPQRWRVIGVSTDITERKKAEEDRSKLESQLLHAQKMEGIGVLAGGIAHDFNNILASILGHAELARFDTAPESPAYGCLAAIESSTQRAADLTRQMLAYSGKGKFLLQQVVIPDEIRDMATLLSASVSKKCELNYQFGDSLPSIEADASQVRQVIMNLVVNASEAIGEKEGVITVSTFAADCSRVYLAGCYVDDQLPEGRYVALEVHDTGVGIGPGVYAKLFDPFFTTKFTGRGLGLAAVMGIVRSHHGAIRVWSQPGKGATFTVLFPAFAPEKCEEAEAGPVAATVTPAGGTILVVDDEEAVRNLAVLALERSGYRVLTAVDGREGVETFQKHMGEISLVLLDMTMPQMDGSEVFEEIQRLQSNTRVILSSGFSEEDTMLRFDHKGLSGFIQKPYRVGELLTIISTALSTAG